MANPVGSTIVSAESAALDDDLWGVPSSWIVDWSSPVKVRNQFTTDVKFSQNMSSSRDGLRGKPRRLVTADLLGMNGADVKVLRASMFRQATARSICPLYPDQTFLTTSAVATDTVLHCDTTYRRFFPGGRILIVAPTARDASILTFEIRTIASLTSSTITVTAGLTSGYTSQGSRVYPVIEGTPVTNPLMSMETDTAGRWALSVQEDVGSSQLPALVGANVTPDEFSEAFSMPVMSIRADWNSTPNLGVERAEIASETGITTTSQMKGLRPVVVGELFFQFGTRADAWSLLRFWDSRRGRLFPFILPLPTYEIDVTAYGTDDVNVKQSGNERDWFFGQYVVFEKTDGSLVIRKIDSWSRGGGVDNVHFTTALTGAGLSAGTVARVTFAIQACFDSDDLTEEWVTDEVMSTALPIREYPFDLVVDITIPEIVTGTPKDPALPPTTDPGDSTPPTLTWYQLEDCNGNLVDIWVPAVPTPPDYLYDPLTNAGYSVMPSSSVTVDPELGTGNVLTGWTELAYPPDNSEDNPPWLPPCVDCPTSAGGYTLWKQFERAINQRKHVQDQPDVDLASLSDADAKTLVTTWFYDNCESFADPRSTYVGTNAVDTDWVWTRARFATVLTLAGSTLSDFNGMSLSNAFRAFQLIWMKAYLFGAGLDYLHGDFEAGGDTANFVSMANSWSLCEASYDAGLVTAANPDFGCYSIAGTDTVPRWGSDMWRSQAKMVFNVPVATGQKVIRAYVITQNQTAYDNNVFDANSDAWAVEDEWTEAYTATTLSGFVGGDPATTVLGSLARPNHASDPSMTPPAFSSANWNGYMGGNKVNGGGYFIVVVGWVMTCIFGAET